MKHSIGFTTADRHWQQSCRTQLAASPFLPRRQHRGQKARGPDGHVQQRGRSRHGRFTQNRPESPGPSGARAVAEAACLAGVTYLDVSGDDVGDAGAVALAASPYLAELTTLLLSYHGIGEEGGLALAASPHLERLRLLDLSDEPLGAAAQAALHGRFGSQVKL